MANLKEKISELAVIVDLHVWIISEEKICLTLTIKSKDLEQQDRTVVSNVKKMLEEEFEITHSTVEMTYSDEMALISPSP